MRRIVRVCVQVLRYIKQEKLNDAIETTAAAGLFIVIWALIVIKIKCSTRTRGYSVSQSDCVCAAVCTGPSWKVIKIFLSFKETKKKNDFTTIVESRNRVKWFQSPGIYRRRFRINHKHWSSRSQTNGRMWFNTFSYVLDGVHCTVTTVCYYFYFISYESVVEWDTRDRQTVWTAALLVQHDDQRAAAKPYHRIHWEFRSSDMLLWQPNVCRTARRHCSPSVYTCFHEHAAFARQIYAFLSGMPQPLRYARRHRLFNINVYLFMHLLRYTHSSAASASIASVVDVNSCCAYYGVAKWLCTSRLTTNVCCSYFLFVESLRA